MNPKGYSTALKKVLICLSFFFSLDQTEFPNIKQSFKRFKWNLQEISLDNSLLLTWRFFTHHLRLAYWSFASLLISLLINFLINPPLLIIYERNPLSAIYVPIQKRQSFLSKHYFFCFMTLLLLFHNILWSCFCGSNLLISSEDSPVHLVITFVGRLFSFFW